VRRATAILCFFLSGAAGLIYEVVWIRQASLVFGSTTFAVSLVLAVFFLGLAAGSEVAGRLARKSLRPLRTYALLELALGVFAAATPFAFRWCELLYGRLYASAFENYWTLTLLRAVLIAAIVILPAMAMGATLPLFTRQFVTKQARVAGSVGFLYGLNTAGAAAGCALTGLVLIPRLGLMNAIMVGAALNLLVAAVVLVLYGRREVTGPSEVPSEAAKGPLRGAGSAAGLFFLVGFSALGYEVLWTRFLGLFLSNTVFTYTLTLTTVLAGIALGSFLAALLFDRVRSHWAVFGVIQIAGGLTVVIAMSLSPEFWRSFQSELWTYAALLFIPSLLSGTAFPLAVRLVVSDPESAAAGTGRLYAVNTLGGIAGALAVGFLVLPGLGLRAGLWITTGAALAGGLIAWGISARRDPRPVSGKTVLAGVIVVGAVLLGAMRRSLPEDFLAEDGEELVGFHEGLTATLAVLREDKGNRLEMNQWWQGVSYKTHQSIAAHIPALLHGHPRRVLVVGAGAGQTPHRFLMHPIERLDCVDIEPAVFDIIRDHFDGEWMNDPRVELIHEDGRSFVSYGPDSYDLISLEVGQLFRPSAASLYTVEFYARARLRLASNGLVCQFVPLPFFTIDEVRRIVATFIEVFPDSVLWYNTSEVLLIGFRDGIPQIDAARLAAGLHREEVEKDLDFSYWGGPAHRLSLRSNFLAGFLAGPSGLREFAGAAPIYSDDRTDLEYTTSRPSAERADAVAVVTQLRESLAPVTEILGSDFGPEELALIRRQRLLNLGDIITAARLREVKRLMDTGNFQRMAELLAEGVKENPENRLALQLLADSFMMLGRPEAAEDHFRKALEIDPVDGPLHRGLAFLLHRRGEPGEAIRHYNALLLQDPHDARVHFGLGLALAATGQHASALHHLETAVQIRPGFEEAAKQAARLRAALNSLQPPPALNLFETIPPDPDAP